jgi:hypothetical protein
MSSPPDLSALPDFGPPQPLNQIDIGAASTYIGMVIVEIEPLGLPGPQAVGWLSRKIRDWFHVAGEGALPGELVPGQRAARVARMRAAGVSEDQIQMVQQMIQQKDAEQQACGWIITFVDGNRASVEVHPPGEGPFGKLREECRQVLTNAIAQERQEDFFADRAREVKQAPYESYDKSGMVVAAGREHEVAVSSQHYSRETRAALAAVALRALEG